MSFVSCIAAGVTLINEAHLGFVTVQDVESQEPTITPTDTPAALLSPVNVKETRFSGGFGGQKLVIWGLEIYLKNYYSDLSESATWRNLVQSVATVFRNSHYLDNLANTDSTMVLLSGENIKVEVDEPPYSQENGLVVRHAVVTVEIQELYQDGM